ncbi:hypothetical protein, partial [Propionibacterium acidifaciens]|uniref:hypothetical protein n=1 Tax=Propionibacterium acidifaciens TaxID=556499 RepID=UPI001B7FDCF1
KHVIVRAFLPPDQNSGFLRGDPDLHAPIISETTREIHEKYDFVSCQSKRHQMSEERYQDAGGNPYEP